MQQKKGAKVKGKVRPPTTVGPTRHSLSKEFLGGTASKYIKSRYVLSRYTEEGDTSDREPGGTSSMKNFPKSFIPMPELLADE